MLSSKVFRTCDASMAQSMLQSIRNSILERMEHNGAARDESSGCGGGIWGFRMEGCTGIDAGLRREVGRWGELAQEQGAVAGLRWAPT